MQDKGLNDLLNDEQFLNYCFNRDAKDRQYWENRLANHPEQRQAIEELRNTVLLLAGQSREREIAQNYTRLQRSIQQKKGRRFPFWYYAAAALLLIGVAFGFYFFLVGSSKLEAGRMASTEILPGYNQATLTLADGTKINLDSAKAGIQVGEENIVYNDESIVPGVILSEGTGKAKSPDKIGKGSLPTSLTLSTPKGGQYQIILSDGTKVWLNAASTLKYPSKFTGDSRTVELEGEAYFQVRKFESPKDGKKGPFIVKSQGQDVKVLGTEFNISAYADESSVKTTLVNGAVQVANYANPSSFELPASNYKRLNPGQQSINSEAGIQVKTVDINSEIAWRNGLFSFNDEPLEAIMRKVARWYDVEVSYQGANKQERFGGGVSRYDDVSTVLKRLEAAGHVHFKVEGRRIIVMD